MADAPVQLIPGDEAKGGPKPGIGLCLSGGGYRAMVFHLGVVWRLYESGVLTTVKRISSVSGGSITAGVLGLKWRELSFDPAGSGTISFPRWSRRCASSPAKTIDAEAILLGLLLPGRISDRVVGAYDEHLYGDRRCRTCRTSRASSSTRPMSSRACCGASRSPTCATTASAR